MYFIPVNLQKRIDALHDAWKLTGKEYVEILSAETETKEWALRLEAEYKFDYIKWSMLSRLA